MADQLQLRGGTTAEHATFTGALREVTVDTTKKTVIVHDNATAGGTPLAKENLSNVPAGSVTSTMLLDGTILNADVNASAAIAGTKISPDFGSQNTTTTGTNTAASFNPTSSTVPTDGLYKPGTNQLAISTNGTGRLFVDASGNIKLGSAAASSFRLAVDGDIWLGNGGGIETGRLFNDTGVLHLRGSSNVTGLAFGMNSTEKVRITSAGLVGIGTSAPGDYYLSELVTYGGEGHGITIASSSTSAEGRIYFADGTSGDARYRGEISYNHGTDSLSFSTAAAPRVRIDSSGRVGIGTLAPSSQFSVGAGSGGTPKISLDYTVDNSSVASISASHTTGEVRYNAVTNYFPTFYSSGSERARIDSSGRLLVGTSSSRTLAGNTAQFQIEGIGYQTASITTNSNDSLGAYIILSKSRGSSLGSNTIVQNNDTLGGIFFNGSDGSTSQYGASIQAYVDGTPGASDLPTRLTFSTTADGAASPTERMRINNAGSLATFTSTNGILAGVGTSGTGGWIYYGTYGATGIFTGTQSFGVYANGNVVNTNNSYGALSDIKLKENITDANSQWDNIKDLRVVNYNFKEGQTHRQIGLIAQEAEQVSPGLVYESPDRDEEGNDLNTVTKSVHYSVLYMKAVKALQEAMERIETLEQRLTDAGIA